jgi:hypothetical protein
MTNHEVEGGLWLHNERAYAVVTASASKTRPERSGLSHADAMTLAEELWRDGEASSVVHVVGHRSYEVDRYPVR